MHGHPEPAGNAGETLNETSLNKVLLWSRRRTDDATPTSASTCSRTVRAGDAANRPPPQPPQGDDGIMSIPLLTFFTPLAPICFPRKILPPDFFSSPGRHMSPFVSPMFPASKPCPVARTLVLYGVLQMLL